MNRIMLLIGLLLVAVGLLAQTAIAPTQGNGSDDNPYQIASWQNLYWITAPDIVDNLTQMQRWSKCYVQTADITFPEDIHTWNNGTGWSPIGLYLGYNEGNHFYFTGSYDGNFKTISGLYINRPLINNQGLFSTVEFAYVEIKNLSLLNVSVIGKDYTGALLGRNEGMVTNCYSTGNVTGNQHTGGLIGYNQGFINKSYSMVTITGNSCCGGLVGSNYSSIYNSFSIGNVTNTGNCSGGLVGTNATNCTISSCYSRGNVIGDQYSGGLAGSNSGTINKSYCAASLLGGCFTGGVTGQNTGSIINSLWDMDASGQTYSSGGIGKTTEEMKTQSTYTDTGWDFSTIWAMDPAINDGYPYLRYPNAVPNDDPTTSLVSSTGAVLHTAYPNPFNPSTTISFDVTNNEKVSINIYNVKGQLVKNICNQMYDKGYHSIIWNGKDNKGTQCGTGVYFYKMQAGKDTQTKKMMMIK